jgi:hypothetical protein
MKDQSNPIRIRTRILLLLVLSLFFAQAVLAQDAKLLAEAKKEGKLVVYGSMEQDIFEGVRQSFQKKNRHPGRILARLRRGRARACDHRAPGR